jgi:hypothetical protein
MLKTSPVNYAVTSARDISRQLLSGTQFNIHQEPFIFEYNSAIAQL